MICRGVISMLVNLRASSFWECLSFYGSDFVARDLGFSASPVVPPAFSFLQSQLCHIAQLKLQEDLTPSALHRANPGHPSTSFIARHIEQQTGRLRALVDSLESFSTTLQSLFFGTHIDTAERYARESLPEELRSIISQLKELQLALRPPCPSLLPGGKDAAAAGGEGGRGPGAEGVETTASSSWNVPGFASTSAASPSINHFTKMFELASRARDLCSPIISQCTDNRVVRDFMVVDISLDNLQQNCLAHVFGFTGLPLSSYLKQSPHPQCPYCPNKHIPYSHPQALLLPWMRINKQQWEPAIPCRYYRYGSIVRLAYICGNLLTGLKMLHPSVDEANALINDWRVLVAQAAHTLSAPVRGANTAHFVDYEQVVSPSRAVVLATPN